MKSLVDIETHFAPVKGPIAVMQLAQLQVQGRVEGRVDDMFSQIYEWTWRVVPRLKKHPPDVV